MKMKQLFLFLCLIFFTVSLCGCEKTQSGESAEFFAMDTVIQITAYGDDAKEALEEARNMINRYDKLFDVDGKESDVTKINEAFGDFVEVEDETIQLVQKSVAISELTKGAFDISIYPVVRAWGFTTDDCRVPDEKEREKLKEIVDYNKITVKENLVKIEKGMALDLGGIAKGYISDKIIEIFQKKKVTSAIVSLGGNIEVMGEKPDGSEYNIGINNPFTEDGKNSDSTADAFGSLIGTVKVKDKAVVTSGDYERFFEQDGVRYHHIMDRTTASPARSDLRSVTVIGEDATMCDGLSTALFVMGKDKALEFQKKHPEYDLILVTTDNKIEATTKDFTSR